MVAAGFLSIFVNLPSDDENKKHHAKQENKNAYKYVFARHIRKASKG